MKRHWRRLARRWQSVAFVACAARSYRSARHRGQKPLDAIRFGLAVARWHRGDRTAHP